MPGVIPAGDVSGMRAEAQNAIAGIALIEIAGAMRPGPESADVLWTVGRGSAFAGLPHMVGRAIDSVFGPGLWEPMAEEHGGLAAPNLPLAAGPPWTVPHEAWHVDEPTSAGQVRSWGLLAFALLDDVAPGGGATIAIAGSHRRLGLLASATIAPGGLLTTEAAMAALAGGEPWFAELFEPNGDPGLRRRFMDTGYVSEGIPLRVAELTGEAGDVVLMDPRCLHTVSANRASRGRLQMRMTCRRS